MRVAGEKIMEIYGRDFEVEYKEDSSPLTEADKTCNVIMMKALIEIYPDIPILSEENAEVPYEERKNWKKFWSLDPLDWTKEFVKKNDEFCISLWLIEEGKPVAGIIYAPVTKELRYASKWQGAYKISPDWSEVKLSGPTPLANTIRVIASRSHQSEELQKYVEELKKKYKTVEFVSKWSALKFCLIAEWKADIYPRLAPTMEWDTAAGDMICREVGKELKLWPGGESMRYGREVLRNDLFVVG